eukprot:TRINITY_DN1230_c0_g1_i1.p1 TRINITY_DN1230_c0_g1~~TRINITY_DN1230_c0_g1_i1.p1  ORF type:complete len:365 (-),score=120.35 TRINITY_DN1230_c0_g1_i1:23-1117(-)
MESPQNELEIFDQIKSNLQKKASDIQYNLEQLKYMNDELVKYYEDLRTSIMSRGEMVDPEIFEKIQKQIVNDDEVDLFENIAKRNENVQTLYAFFDGLDAKMKEKIEVVQNPDTNEQLRYKIELLKAEKEYLGTVQKAEVNRLKREHQIKLDLINAQSETAVKVFGEDIEELKNIKNSLKKTFKKIENDPEYLDAVFDLSDIDSTLDTIISTKVSKESLALDTTPTKNATFTPRSRRRFSSNSLRIDGTRYSDGSRFSEGPRYSDGSRYSEGPRYSEGSIYSDGSRFSDGSRYSDYSSDMEVEGVIDEKLREEMNLRRILRNEEEKNDKLKKISGSIPYPQSPGDRKKSSFALVTTVREVRNNE